MTFSPGGASKASAAALVSTGASEVAVGTAWDSNGNAEAWLAAFDGSGALDKSFGSDGTEMLQFGTATAGQPASSGVGDAIAVPGGKLLLVGGASNGLLVARLNRDGSRDTSFGNNGVALSGADPSGSQVALGPGGEIYVVAGLNVVRFTPGGTLDSAWGDHGRAAMPGDTNGPTALAVQADGSLLAAGNTGYPGCDGNSSREDLVVARFSPTGQLDRSFGTNGFVVHNFSGSSTPATLAVRLAVTPAGRILVAGYTEDLWCSQGDEAYVAALTRDGALDTRFGSSGVYQTSAPHARAYGMAVQPDGKILLSGERNFDTSFVSRLTPTGSLDATFGTDGTVTHGPAASPSEESYSTVAVTADGPFYAAGWFSPDRQKIAFLVSRYLKDPPPPPSHISISGIPATEESGVSFDASVATFTDDLAGTRAADYAATIDWGDGTQSAGSISENDAPGDKHFTVHGTHAYPTGGKYNVVVTVTPTNGSSAPAQVSTSITVDTTCPSTSSTPTWNNVAAQICRFSKDIGRLTDLTGGLLAIAELFPHLSQLAPGLWTGALIALLPGVEAEELKVLDEFLKDVAGDIGQEQGQALGERITLGKNPPCGAAALASLIEASQDNASTIETERKAAKSLADVLSGQGGGTTQEATVGYIALAAKGLHESVTKFIDAMNKLSQCEVAPAAAQLQPVAKLVVVWLQDDIKRLEQDRERIKYVSNSGYNLFPGVAANGFTSGATLVPDPTTGISCPSGFPSCGTVTIPNIPSLNIHPTAPDLGGQFTVMNSGFANSSAASIGLSGATGRLTGVSFPSLSTSLSASSTRPKSAPKANAQPLRLAVVKTDSRGRLSATVRIPATVVPGLHELYTIGLAPDGTTRVLATKIHVIACVVPNLKGKTLHGARGALRKAHCRLGKATPTLKHSGRVKKQNPRAGRIERRGSKVNVKLG